MKKRKLIEKRRALKEAYYNELKKMGVLDPVETKEVKKTVKKTNKKVEE